MKRLFIAEKPSLARAIADGLGQPQEKDGDSIRCGNDIVAWCAGHILELINPGDYDDQFKKWCLNTLPIIPDQWKYTITKGKLFSTIKARISEVDQVVHAGDPDREGQLLIDEVLDAIGCQLPVKRVLINDLNQAAVTKALDNLRDNSEFASLSQSALARSRADWLYGMNMTRLYTLLAQNGHYDGVISVGGVQTPVLGLIVRRDLEIKHFIAKPYYKVNASIVAAHGGFSATWSCDVESTSRTVDDDGRLLDHAEAVDIANRVTGIDGVVSQLEKKTKRENAPLPFSLSSLQMLVFKRIGLDPSQTLETVQGLYETHRLVTYPRSDCTYLPEEHRDEIADVVHAIKENNQGNARLDSIIGDADFTLCSSAWNNKKVTAHHAIIPTPNAGGAVLSDRERAVYDIICERYLLQFYTPHIFEQTHISVTVNEEVFNTVGRVTRDLGWKRFSNKEDSDDEKDDSKGHSNTTASLPALALGKSITIADAACQEKATKPPKHFNDATLLSAMTGIARFVKDEALKTVLKDTDGLGTEATRASIIQTLFDRGYVVKKGKNTVSTDVAQRLVSALPEVSTVPDMRARWEMSMNAIRDQQTSLSAFLGDVQCNISTLVEEGKRLEKLTLVDEKSLPKCPACQGILKNRKGEYSHYWPCRPCNINYKDVGGKPDLAPKKAPEKTEFTCGECGEHLVRRISTTTNKGTATKTKTKRVAGRTTKKSTAKSKIKSTAWYGCSGFPDCKTTYFERNGKPQY